MTSLNQNTLITSILITPKSFKEVKSTGLWDLKLLCKDAVICVDGIDRASPDAILKCDCQGSQIKEVKCPYKVRDIDPKQAVLENKIDYVKSGSTGEFVVVCGYKYGYYEHNMTQLAPSIEKNGTFIIWTQLGILDIPIKFDEKYWIELVLPKVTKFYKSNVIPEIITGKLKKEVSSVTNLAEENDEVSHSNKLSDEDLDDNEKSNIIDNENANNSSNDDFLPKEDSNNNSLVIFQVYFNLDCASYCRDSEAPTYSRIKRMIISYIANTDFRRLDLRQLTQKYVGKKCRVNHPKYESLRHQWIS